MPGFATSRQALYPSRCGSRLRSGTEAIDAQNPGFWHALVGSASERKVANETAIFAIRTLLTQVIGYKARRAQIDFDRDPITVEDLFTTLEKLCGGAAGWQLAQKLAGY